MSFLYKAKMNAFGPPKNRWFHVKSDVFKSMPGNIQAACDEAGYVYVAANSLMAAAALVPDAKSIEHVGIFFAVDSNGG